MRELIAVGLLAAIMWGCMVGPDYRRPSVETPRGWRFEEKDAVRIGNASRWGGASGTRR